jgi:hypothetical protein
VSGFLGSLGQEVATSKSVKVLDLFTQSNKDVSHFIESATQTLHQSEAENKSKEVKSLVKEVNQQVVTNSTKDKVEKVVESIAKDTATKKDEAKVSNFLKSIPEVIP